MTPAESKLDAIKDLLEHAAYPEFDTDEFWLQVEADCDNATWVISENAELINNILKVLNDD
jgi:hypothetical protein